MWKGLKEPPSRFCISSCFVLPSTRFGIAISGIPSPNVVKHKASQLLGLTRDLSTMRWERRHRTPHGATAEFFRLVFHGGTPDEGEAPRTVDSDLERLLAEVHVVDTTTQGREPLPSRTPPNRWVSGRAASQLFIPQVAGAEGAGQVPQASRPAGVWQPRLRKSP